MGRLFGTDGVRGVANQELTAELAFKLGQAGAYVLSGGGNKRAKILIGKDTRKSSDMLEAAIVAGVCSVGADAIVIGTAPTPAIAYITRTRGYDAGIVISASHNPFEFNGIKFFSGSGYKLNDDIEAEIESIILDGTPEMKLPIGEGLGNVTYDFDAKREYMDFAKSTIDVDFKGMTIAIDCANGASSVTSEYVLRELGADVRVINNKPDGININTNCGSTHIEGLCEFVKSEKADLGLAFDGDADRVLAVDENGVLVDGDKIMTICGLFMRDEGKLKKDTIVATVMSNLGFFIMAEKNNLNTAQTKVGDRYVLEEMLDKGYSLGGEQSGHIIFLEHNTTGDGLVTALQLVQAVKKQGKRLSELASLMTILPQVLINAKVKTENKNSYMEIPEIKSEIEKLTETFNGEGRVLIRPSGTEPLVRVMIEGKDIDFITEKAKNLADLIEKKLG